MSWTKQVSGNLKCGLCPHNCLIKENSYGICSARFNKNSRLYLPLRGVLSALNIDPIEKKPLFHFYPGSKVLSLGFFGCNFHCQFCQNHEISQTNQTMNGIGYIAPEKLIDICIEKNIQIIAYTYSEPVIHYEYIMECSKKASKKGIKNVLVTNGYINSGPGVALLKKIDGVNVDLKAFSDTFYRKLGGSIAPVKEFIEQASELSHLEVTTLIIPGENDSEEEILEISSFIGDLDKNIPLHISRFYPSFNYTIPSKNIDSLKLLVNRALEYLNYVYPGNIEIKDNNTCCLNCGHILINRRAYSIMTSGIVSGKCTNCSTPVPFPV